jgi:hypothetical protein
MPTPRRALLSLAATLLLTSTPGCKDDEVKTLFEENGVWALVQFDLTGTGFQDIADNRSGGFLLKFDSGKGVVGTAACTDNANNNSPSQSLCRFDYAATWTCRCFAYEFEESAMRWMEFDPGSAPPPVPDGPPADTDGGATGYTELEVGAFPDQASTYQFRPLPTNLFASDGVSSTFVFQRKATTTWSNPNDLPAQECDACF